MTLKDWQNRFPAGSKVKTEFYPREKNKLRVVAEVCKAPHGSSQNNVYLRTKCGLFCDIGWFEEG